VRQYSPGGAGAALSTRPAGLLTWIKHIFRFLAISTLLVAFVAFGAWICGATGQTLWMMGKEEVAAGLCRGILGIACLLALPMSNEIRDFCSEAEARPKRSFGGRMRKISRSSSTIG